ncbi:ComF family protein [Deefgea rivuli]|uniref:ComF family protein n=1 Tax=Deefgea rivuli TaxID=400948 RepID=UPI000A7DAC6B|nr:ComF family protein [Deefgea rivuli]
MRWQATESCPCCAIPNTQGHRCGQCLKASPALDKSYAAFIYTDPVASLIQAAKFAQQWTLLPPLGQILAELPLTRPDVLIALPLHAARLRERGFNQALEIARPIAEKLNIQLEMGRLTRQKNTEHQARLSANARWQNMRNAFHYAGDLSGARVALIDDVMTSGASLNAAANVLKAAGAREVEAWVLARTA